MSDFLNYYMATKEDIYILRVAKTGQEFLRFSMAKSDASALCVCFLWVPIAMIRLRAIWDNSSTRQLEVIL